jgi:hypothetical protein
LATESKRGNIEIKERKTLSTEEIGDEHEKGQDELA